MEEFSTEELIKMYKELKQYSWIFGSIDPKFFFTMMDKLIAEYETLKRDFDIVDHEEHRLDMRNNELLLENTKLRNIISEMEVKL